MNLAPKCALTITQDVSGDAQGSVPILLSLLHATQALNQELSKIMLDHTPRIAMNCLTTCQTLPWAARLPDLSPIEHIWDMMGMRLNLLGNVDYLARQLEQIWQEISQTIRVPYHSMPRCVAAYTQARKVATPY
ncbi:transposable element Tcb1 transposase [Trichonephila clavipes]|uniref:Transposable element Tcb1 transposase n=1 Tax=Trichonephila clavipes TaxID=2585209 RepID=A0A8X6VFK0_TRICX|nr:transposable element Tcb1 transposase [Trichonephila clavipes]